MKASALVLLAPLVVAGCGIGGLFAPKPEDLSDWRAEPLPPDPALDAKAIESCRPAGENFVLQVVLQDRHLPSTAAFLVAAAPNWSGSCMVTSIGMGGGGLSTVPLPGLSGRITVDEQSISEVGDGHATLHGGRIAADVVGVVVTLDDGRTVTASVGNGHWLASWTGGVAAASVTATTGSGEAETLVWNEGWVVK